jgi:hypothetical protein
MLHLEAEAQIEALFNSSAVRGGCGPLAKVEAKVSLNLYSTYWPLHPVPEPPKLIHNWVWGVLGRGARASKLSTD